MKIILTFLFFWIFATLVAYTATKVSKEDALSITKSLLFGLATATIASVVLTVIVYLF